MLKAFVFPLLISTLGLSSCQSDSAQKQEAAAATPCAPQPAAYQVQHPDWLAHSSIYEVNLRQYTPEGTFRAFEQHLPRLEKMGVGILWLMPVHPVGKLNRKGSLGSQYSVRDYRAVNPELGTMEDLKHLVAEAHKRKMHVILDWVANHTSWDNVLTKTHPDWYTRSAQGSFQPPVADWQDVIDLDYRKPELRRYMTESMVYWVKNADIDGFRCDVAGLVPTDFWNTTRRELEKVKPVFMLAEWDELFPPTFLKKEDFDPNTRLLEKAFDATYALRQHGLLDSLARGQRPVSALARYFAAERAMYPVGTVLMNFTSSHDVNSWDGTEMERLGPNARPLAVLTALLPGLPMVYSGQESAQPKRLKFFDKDPIAWNGYPLQDFYTQLLQLQKNHPALAVGDPCGRFRLLPAPANTIAFERSTADSTARVWVGINLSSQPQRLTLPAGQTSYFDQLGPKDAKPVGSKTVQVEPHGYRIFTSEHVW